MKHVLFLCTALAACVTVSHAQNRGFGIGIVLGEPTGLSGKYWLAQTTAIDGGLAWSFARESSMHIHADHLWHMFDALKTNDVEIPLYVGVGGRMKLAKDARLGVRIVGGINYLVYSVPLDLFLEIAPIMDLIPATNLAMNGGIGIRFFFDKR
jgi:hypothetical protein